MDKDKPSQSAIPAQAMSPEEDATLLAIEALEAQTIDPDPGPLNRNIISMPASFPVPPVPAATPTPIAPPPASVVVKSPAPPVVVPTPPPVAKESVPEVVAVEPKPKPIPSPAPQRVLSTAEKIAEALSGAPTTTAYQFFTYKTPPRMPFIIGGILALLIGAGVAAYFTLR